MVDTPAPAQPPAAERMSEEEFERYAPVGISEFYGKVYAEARRAREAEAALTKWAGYSSANVEQHPKYQQLRADLAREKAESDEAIRIQREEIERLHSGAALKEAHDLLDKAEADLAREKAEVERLRPRALFYKSRADKLEAALREIAEPRGTFSLDKYEFACNVIESMKGIAADALEEK
jgi:hypothetical protein